ncbi:hypothetical protein MGG_17220 [Pyricularia oryzae 70-15]|uniref:Protein kinase domain-containing protein n=1 Tax=Pyricularia oryzae (strain 70-15 / ATCC MYA-4617 / FGSC 8958) TaxID=242507 RepID=G4N8S0_PYRO7|nr:uncharacterized protein MGG_17210 [Pyricularia oryzae 70-15]XP_003717385.1 uncharacterized protein MGG_17220 [Pyricularia oryzae 70-15]EHA51053.1 hypothetical protein MGG_17210 [Pyricularia oryzae 70-15]EHA51066.1 hypothetical protein MGG_17220 [Pyricularia oryzae 70-15]
MTDMDEELKKLREQLEEAKRRTEDAEKRIREEQRRREGAEDAARASQPLAIEPYLDACHSLSLAIQVLTDRSLTTQSDTTDPIGRVYPSRISKWDEFAAKQEEIWNLLSDPSFTSRPTFPSRHQVDYVRSLISPISSEHGLRHFERNTVENAVQKLVDAVFENELLRQRLGLHGTVTFESHTNLGAADESLSEPLEQMTVSGPSVAGASSATAKVRKPRRTAKSKGKGNRADQFCIYRTTNGANTPTMAIEYKAPHKLSQDEVVTGLASAIEPKRDVIGQDCEGFVLASKALTAAVVTQLFSYMIGKGIKHGYVCTGQTFVFLHIPDDPATVLYHVCVPNLDVFDDDVNRLHRTAVAQVFAFVLQAVRTAPPPQSWHDAAATLETWAVEYEDVLAKIPSSVRKDKERASPYIPRRWQGFKRSPIRTRAFCRQLPTQPLSDEDEDDNDFLHSPTPKRSSNFHRNGTPGSGGRREGRGGLRAGKSQGIQDMLYCSHKCLLGLKCRRPVDKTCPNASSHGQKHIDRAEFLSLLQAQLAKDRGPDADCTPLYLSGFVGSLFKVRLSLHGYTLVAKGVETANLEFLQHEEKVYNRLSEIQGRHVPVYLGLMSLVLPQYCDGGVYKHFLLLSWAGKPLSSSDGRIDKFVVTASISKAITAIHRLGVLHGDAEARNILVDGQHPMVVDFERATIPDRAPLGSISANAKLKRKHGPSQKRGNDAFAKEFAAIQNVFN